MNQMIKELLDSMSLISSSTVVNTQPTITGQIKSYDKTNNVYVVEASGSFYSAVSNISYEIGTLVYIDVLNDSNKAVILGSSTSVTEEAVIEVDIKADYQTIAEVTKKQTFSTDVTQNETTVLWKVDKDSPITTISIDNDLLTSKIASADAIYASVKLTADFEDECYTKPLEQCVYELKITFSNDEVISLGINDVEGYPYEVTEQKLEKLIMPDWLTKHTAAPTISKIEFVVSGYPETTNATTFTLEEITVELLQDQKAYLDEIAARTPSALISNSGSKLKVDIQDRKHDDSTDSGITATTYTWYWKVKYDPNKEDLVDWIEIPGAPNAAELDVSTLQHRKTTAYKCQVTYYYRDYPNSLTAKKILVTDEIEFINNNITDENNNVLFYEDPAPEGLASFIIWDQEIGLMPPSEWTYTWQYRDIFDKINPLSETSNSLIRSLADVKIAETIICIVHYKTEYTAEGQTKYREEFLAQAIHGLEEPTSDTQDLYTLDLSDETIVVPYKVDDKGNKLIVDGWKDDIKLEACIFYGDEIIKLGTEWSLTIEPNKDETDTTIWIIDPPTSDNYWNVHIDNNYTLVPDGRYVLTATRTINSDVLTLKKAFGVVASAGLEQEHHYDLTLTPDSFVKNLNGEYTFTPTVTFKIGNEVQSTIGNDITLWVDNKAQQSGSSLNTSVTLKSYSKDNILVELKRKKTDGTYQLLESETILILSNGKDGEPGYRLDPSPVGDVINIGADGVFDQNGLPNFTNMSVAVYHGTEAVTSLEGLTLDWSVDNNKLETVKVDDDPFSAKLKVKDEEVFDFNQTVKVTVKLNKNTKDENGNDKIETLANTMITWTPVSDGASYSGYELVGARNAKIDAAYTFKLYQLDGANRTEVEYSDSKWGNGTVKVEYRKKGDTNWTTVTGNSITIQSPLQVDDRIELQVVSIDNEIQYDYDEVPIVKDESITITQTTYYVLMNHTEWGAPKHPRDCGELTENGYKFTIGKENPDDNKNVFYWNTTEPGSEAGALLWGCDATIQTLGNTTPIPSWSEIYPIKAWNSTGTEVDAVKLSSLAEAAKFWASGEQGIMTTEAGDVHLNASKIKTGALQVGGTTKNDALLYADIDGNGEVKIAGWEINKTELFKEQVGIYSGNEEKKSLQSLVSNDNKSAARFYAGAIFSETKFDLYLGSEEELEKNIQIDGYIISDPACTSYETNDGGWETKIEFEISAPAPIPVRQLLPSQYEDAKEIDVTDVKVRGNPMTEFEFSLTWINEDGSESGGQFQYNTIKGDDIPELGGSFIEKDEEVYFDYNKPASADAGTWLVSCYIKGQKVLKEAIVNGNSLFLYGSAKLVYDQRGFGVLDDGSVYADAIKSRTKIQAAVIEASQIRVKDINITGLALPFDVASNADIDSIF